MLSSPRKIFLRPAAIPAGTAPNMRSMNWGWQGWLLIGGIQYIVTIIVAVSCVLNSLIRIAKPYGFYAWQFSYGIVTERSLVEVLVKMVVLSHDWNVFYRNKDKHNICPIGYNPTVVFISIMYLSSLQMRSSTYYYTCCVSNHFLFLKVL
jgi:hypothetical protein